MKLKNDIQVIKQRDPAARSSLEIFLTYPGLHAIRSHRRAHFFYKHHMKLIARIISTNSKFFTGIEIHPGAVIGDGFFIDHGAGVVIGETTIIGKNVTIFQGVTLGGTGKDVGKRHPTIEDDVMISAGAKVLGPFTVGKGSKIGAGSVVLKEVPPYSTVVGIPGKVVKTGNEQYDSQNKSMNQIKMPDPVLEALDCMTLRIKDLEKQIKTLEFANFNITVGNTPSKILEDSTNKLIIKEEYFNPTGSIKDRTVYNILFNAFIKNKINKDSVIVEATSGNTGIAISYIAHKLGIKCNIFMPENMSKERIKIMQDYGAIVTLTAQNEGMKGSICKMNEFVNANPNSFIVDQFNSKYNAPAHHKTAQEIVEAYPDIDYIVVGIGTGGTATGIQEYLDKIGSKTEVVAIEPASSPLLTKGVAGTHKIQGIGANFVPKVLNRDIVKNIKTVTDEDALACTTELYKKYNIKAGISTGANYSVAKELFNSGKSIVFIASDSGDRYLSLDLYK